MDQVSERTEPKRQIPPPAASDILRVAQQQGWPRIGLMGATGVVEVEGEHLWRVLAKAIAAESGSREASWCLAVWGALREIASEDLGADANDEEDEEESERRQRAYCCLCGWEEAGPRDILDARIATHGCSLAYAPFKVAHIEGERRPRA